MLPPNTPAEIDGYKVIDYLGGGSYGHVYRVSLNDTHEYALKWLRADAERRGKVRFRNEIWALKHLDHKTIPKLIDEGQHDERPFFVMTLAPGKSLRELFRVQSRDRAVSGELKVLAILEAVLSAIVHMQEQSIYHRDVKDDNILCTASVSDVSLIDFGFCRGEGQPEDVSSFYQIGAPRYSPPEKLRHPSRVHPTHDVFAVGVVGYLLLTNQYPWSVDRTEDSGDLQTQMREITPIKISEINNMVSSDVSKLFARLLDIDDNRRISAELARKDLQRIRIKLSRQRAAPAINRYRRIRLPHVLRDAVHGDIRITDFEQKIINSKEFQRLRWIKQLGFANLVYPTAEHTRFSHAIGTMHLADKILTSIEDVTGVSFYIEERLMARCYALTHDLTHISYGHTLEDELAHYQRHDSNKSRLLRLLLSDKSHVGTLLRSTDYGREVLAHFDPASAVAEYSHIKEIVDGPLGSDVLDYIDRDAYFCGLDHRIDSAIFRRYKIVSLGHGAPEKQHLVSLLYGTHGFRLDAEFALESILLERFSLFLKVYTHPAKTTAGAMLGKALAQATLGVKRSVVDEQSLEWMGDAELILLLRDSKKQLCRKLARMLLERKLYETVYRASALKSGERSPIQYRTRQDQFATKGLLDPGERKKVEGRLARNAGISPADVIVYCTTKAPGYQKVEQYVEHYPGHAEVRDYVHTSHLSIMDRHLALWAVYVFVSPDHDKKAIERLGDVSKELFGFDNEISKNRRQGVLFGNY